MNILQHKGNETSKANHLIADGVHDVNTESMDVFDTEEYGWIASRSDDVAFGISILMVLFLIASVMAIAFYTVT